MYNKLFSKILDSSIWLEPSPTRIVWMMFIATMDEDGFVQFASVANVAHRAIITTEEAEKAITVLESPDPNSSDPDHEGRRIERVEGGWVVLNSAKYRDLVTRAMVKEQTRLRVARYRAKKRNGNGDVTPSDTDTIAKADVQPSVVAPKNSGFEEFWKAYPRKKSKGAAEQAWKKPHPPLEIILSALDRAKQSHDWTKEGGKYIPHPASWLNAKGWEDEFHAQSPRPLENQI